MNATEEFRRMLDERGVEWVDTDDGLTLIPAQTATNVAWEVSTWPSGKDMSDCLWVQNRHPLTPEQAIAATLGEQHGIAEIDELLDKFEHECFMLRVEASETRAKEEDVRKAYERIREEAARAIAATLGSDREAELQKALNKAAGNWAKADAELRKALDFMRIWISEDAHLGESAISCEFEKAEGLRKLDAIESAIAATLGSGKLTAEQVRDAWCGNLKRDCLYDPPTPDWQAIADELNAALGGGECECVWNEQEGTFHCSSCGTLLTNEIDIEWPSHKVTPITMPNYCRNCGKSVKR